MAVRLLAIQQPPSYLVCSPVRGRSSGEISRDSNEISRAKAPGHVTDMTPPDVSDNTQLRRGGRGAFADLPRAGRIGERRMRNSDGQFVKNAPIVGSIVTKGSVTITSTVVTDGATSCLV